MLKAGMARVDITPPQGLELAGYPHYPRNNTGAHDPLYAACMYLNNGEEESKVHLEALFNTVHQNKELIKGLFNR